LILKVKIEEKTNYYSGRKITESLGNDIVRGGKKLE
jgi:hypothetical protein